MSGVPGLVREDVWYAELDPVVGHEQAGRRPVVILSSDSFNAGRSGLVVIAPITSRVRPLPLHVPVLPPEGGLTMPSAILCDGIRSVDRTRLLAYMGSLDPTTMLKVERGLRSLLVL